MDKRIERTNTKLRYSLLTLLKKTNLKKITVLELCKEAKVNRTTFYKYYDDVDDYINKVEAILMEELKKEITSINRNYLITYIGKIVERIKSEKELYPILLGNNGDKTFLRKILYLVHSESLQEWQRLLKKATSEDLNKIYTFIVDGSVGIIENWINNNCKDDPKTIALFINKLCMSGLSSFI